MGSGSDADLAECLAKNCRFEHVYGHSTLFIEGINNEVCVGTGQNRPSASDILRTVHGVLSHMYPIRSAYSRHDTRQTVTQSGQLRRQHHVSSQETKDNSLHNLS
jgi:hypothetical protein